MTLINMLMFCVLSIALLTTTPSLSVPTSQKFSTSQPTYSTSTNTIHELKDSLKSTLRQQDTTTFTCPPNGEVRVRKEIRNLTPSELRRWRTAMTTIMTERPDNAPFSPPPSFWDSLVAIHIIYRDEAHGGSYFLPWHRLFLLYLENYIRDTLYPDFTLPYWDWSVDAADAALSPVWSDNYLGGAESGPSPIPSGPFAGLFAHYLSRHLMTRNFTSGVSGDMLPLVNSSILDAIVTNTADWSDFSDAVETAHDRVHVQIGGDMINTLTSPNDPVFYLHHAFVDKIWHDRQVFTGDVSEFGGSHDFFPDGEPITVPASSDFVFQFYELSVSQILNDQNCVTYQPFRRSARTAPSTVANSSAPVEADSTCDQTNMMTEERCHHGEEVIESVA